MNHFLMQSEGSVSAESYLEVYPFRQTDAGRAQSLRPKQINDSAVRALALVCGLAYDEAYDLLASAGRKSHRHFDFTHWVESASRYGYLFSWHHFPAIKGRRRINPITFCQRYNKGRWVIKTTKHVAAVIDGVLHDEFLMRPNRCIYGAWKVER